MYGLKLGEFNNTTGTGRVNLPACETDCFQPGYINIKNINSMKVCSLNLENFIVFLLSENGKPSFQSSILKQDSVRSTLNEWLQGSGYGDRRWMPCINSLEDEITRYKLQNLCGGKGPTISVLKSGDYIFGGFFERSWPSTLNYFVILYIQCFSVSTSLS